jgi:hypothetical protein
LSPSDPPEAYVQGYISCLNSGQIYKAQTFWVDVGVPKHVAKATFQPTGQPCRIDRDQFGMGVNGYRYIVAIPGTYTQTSNRGEASRQNNAVFILLRGARYQRWAILESTNTHSGPVSGC